MEREVQRPLSFYIGWCLLLAGLSQIPLVIAGLRLFSTMPKVSQGLLALSVPVMLLLALGGIGLILYQPFGFYSVYAAVVFGGISGLNISFVPLIRQWVNIGPRTDDLFLGLNLVVVAVVAWEHWRRISNLEHRAEWSNRAAVMVMLLLGVASVAYGRSNVAHHRGEAARISEVPVIGRHLEGLETTGAISFVGVETKLNDGITMAFSGTASEEQVRAFAEGKKLAEMTEPAQHRKFLPQTKRWKLDGTKFPTSFSDEDIYFIGKPATGQKLILQLVQRRKDGRFTAEVMGVAR
jgi:hypothetical protein